MTRRHRTAHLTIWIVLALAAPAIILLALSVRPDDPAPSVPEAVRAAIAAADAAGEEGGE